jgi:hypothetical protein
MYPYLPGAASSLATASVMSERDIAEAARRSAAERAQHARHRARRSAGRQASSATAQRDGVFRHRLLHHLAHLLHKRPPAVP